MTHPAASLGVVVMPGAVEQDAPHQLRGDPEEVRSILPADLPLINKPQKGLVDQSRGYERLARALPPHVSMRKPVQLLINQRHQLLERRLIALIPGKKQLGNLLC
jgi:hypothetical protein